MLSRFLDKAGYDSESANSIEDFDQVLESSGKIDLALVDLAGFDRNIWDRCDRLRNANIPFLIISAAHLESVEQDSVTHGAQGVLMKPLASKDLLGIIRGLLQESV